MVMNTQCEPKAGWGVWGGGVRDQTGEEEGEGGGERTGEERSKSGMIRPWSFPTCHSTVASKLTLCGQCLQCISDL